MFLSGKPTSSHLLRSINWHLESYATYAKILFNFSYADHNIYIYKKCSCYFQQNMTEVTYTIMYIPVTQITHFFACSLRSCIFQQFFVNFILICPFHSNLRTQFVPKFYVRNPNMIKFIALLNIEKSLC